MNIILNAIVLIFEVLYYALFMKFARKEGNFWRYNLLFLLISLIFSFVGTRELYSYLLLILTILYGIKFIVKTKVSLYDALIIIVMLGIKLIVEFPIYFVGYKILELNHTFITMLLEITKIFLILIIGNKLNVLYLKFKKIWDNNNFYIRYIFSCSMFIYVIVTVILKVIMPFVR